jgi:hypothetical protein
VVLGCSGAPAQTTCSVLPASIVLSGASASTAAVTVTTTGGTSGVTEPAGGPPANFPFGAWALFAGTPGMVLLGSTMRYHGERRPQLRYALTLCLLSFGIGMSACGGGSGGSPASGGTPAGNYSLTVTGTYTTGSTTLTHNTKLTLVVQ